MSGKSKHKIIDSPEGDTSNFYAQPILNSPYEEPCRHWELDEDRQPTKNIRHERRKADFITPVPKPKKARKAAVQADLMVDKTKETAEAISDKDQEYHKAIINDIRRHVGQWRKLPKSDWKVTPITARLLEHWRNHKFNYIRPFFCQIEAVETAIWLTEVAPNYKKFRDEYLAYLEKASTKHNPGLLRLALKMATGSGKTTVMAMLIAWQTLNAIRSSSSKFSKGFLIVAPGLTIRDRLQVLKPNDPNAYYKDRELVPSDMLRDLQQARIVITNYHAFMLREKYDVSSGTRSVLEGWRGNSLNTRESEGEMLQRVMPELVGMKKIIVINDEAHHCYREKIIDSPDDEFYGLKGVDKTDAKNEAKDRQEAARVWISGLEAVQRHIGISRVFDLSATPFFLAGSGYVEGTIFPWTMSDFSLMDAIECGIVKLPRIPISDNISSLEVPMYRNLWENIRDNMPKKGKVSTFQPQDLPSPLITAIDGLYGQYKKTFERWKDANISVPPCFIIVCNNTSTSKLIFDYISGYEQTLANGETVMRPGLCELFRNFADDGSPLSRPHTLLIDSAQLERGDILDSGFREAAKEEIERFRREVLIRGGKLAAEVRSGKDLSEAAILREVMNTVGKKGQLGESIRCVVSVGMLSEGWDANTVTHILGVRAFGTQLLCEQVIGRALRRQSYQLNENGLLDVEYADALGIPFDFADKPKIIPPPPPVEVTHVHAVRPERDALEITFPRIIGYRAELLSDKLQAEFTDDSKFTLTPEITGATDTRNSGIIGNYVDITLDMSDVRDKTVLMYLTKYLLEKYFRDEDGIPKLYLYGQLKQITWEWMRDYFKCVGGTQTAQLMIPVFADIACDRIHHAILKYSLHNKSDASKKLIRALPDPFNPLGSSIFVNFRTTKRDLWTTDERKCEINYVVCDGNWEAEFCRVLEKDSNHVMAYVKNHNLGFEIPYRLGAESRIYRPDFIVRIDDNHEVPLNLIVEIKGYRGEDAKAKKLTMENFWVPGVNNLEEYGRWDFLELTDKNTIASDFEAAVKQIRSGKSFMQTGSLLNA